MRAAPDLITGEYATVDDCDLINEPTAAVADQKIVINEKNENESAAADQTTVDGNEVTVEELSHTTANGRTEPHIINSDEYIAATANVDDDDDDDAIAGGEQRRIDENITVVENDETDFIQTTNNENVCKTDDTHIGCVSDINSVPEVINFELQTEPQTDHIELIAGVSAVLDEILVEAESEALKQSELASRTEVIRALFSNEKLVEDCEKSRLSFDTNDNDANANVIESGEPKTLVDAVIDKIDGVECAVNVPNETELLDDKEVEFLSDARETKSATEASKSNFIDQLPTTQDIYRQVESCYRAASATPPPVPLVTYRWEDVKRDKIKVFLNPFGWLFFFL